MARPSFYDTSDNNSNYAKWAGNCKFIANEWYLIAGLSGESIYDRVAQKENAAAALVLSGCARDAAEVDISMAFITLSDAELEYIWMTTRDTNISIADNSGTRVPATPGAFSNFINTWNGYTQDNSERETEQNRIMLQNVEQIKLHPSQKHKLHTSAGETHMVNTGKHLAYSNHDNYANMPPDKWGYNQQFVHESSFKTLNWGKIHPALFDNDLKYDVGIWIYTIPKMAASSQIIGDESGSNWHHQVDGTGFPSSPAYSGSASERSENRASGLRYNQEPNNYPPQDSDIPYPIFPAGDRRAPGGPSDAGPYDYNSSNNVSPNGNAGNNLMEQGVKKFESGDWTVRDPEW